MSTMYYTWPGDVPIGQTHSKGKDRGMHLTWCIWPIDLATHMWQGLENDNMVVDEYRQYFTYYQFLDIIHRCSSMSFDREIE